ncbi:hypothetical protein K9848_03455 [Latilactobacillus sakei]|uniref:hypothetical protein n=1 Tax=Latilactobacillus sakei TaxID=1599 RepID=UPI0020C7C7EF|nr:hypothetical protein [Latilactobacillus sakei]MCP8855246.1 hypothetical protein [Latilactobacillus sakei]
MEITESIKRLYRLVTHHIGSGGDAHAIVNTIQPGFMTPKQKADLIEAKGLRTWVATPEDGSRIDVLSMDVGHYYGIYTAFTNTPSPSQETPENAAFVEIDVLADSNEPQTRKQIRFRVSSNGIVWEINTHYSLAVGGNADGYPKLWQRISKHSDLWSGNVSAAGAVMTLADKLVNYQYINISYNVLAYSSTKRFDITPNMTLRDLNIPNSETDKSFSVFEAILTYDPSRPSELKLTSTTGRHAGGSSVTIDDTTQITITKIEGVK